MIKGTVLHGHVSEETAHTTDDYPYGGHRTSCRWWLETKPKHGMRVMQQTQNPKNGRWNKPHASTYCEFQILYLDEKGHCHNYGCGMYGDNLMQFIGTGFYHQLNEEELKRFNTLLTVNRVMNKESWARFDTIIGIARENPTLDAKTVTEQAEAKTPSTRYYEMETQRVLEALEAERANGPVDFNPGKKAS